MEPIERVQRELEEITEEMKKLRQERIVKSRHYGELVREAQKIKAEVVEIDAKLKQNREVLVTKLTMLRDIPRKLRR